MLFCNNASDTKTQPGRRGTAVTSGIIVASLLLVATGHASAEADEFGGYWVTPNFISVVEISRCDKSLCAEIAWLWQIAVAGKQLRDAKNPDSDKRRNSLLGLPLFRKFKQDGERWRGRIYNPLDGRRYRASITQINHNMLKLRGCWGPFCQTQRWRRLGSFSMPSIEQLEKRK